MDLTELRQQIDQIDEKILALFIERMEVSGQIAQVKQAEGKAVFDPQREKEKIAEIERLAGEEWRADAKKLYTVLMELSRAYQRRLGVELVWKHSD